MVPNSVSDELREIADAIEREGPLARRLDEMARELLNVYVKDNGGDMPENNDHPAHKLKAVLDEIDRL